MEFCPISSGFSAGLHQTKAALYNITKTTTCGVKTGDINSAERPQHFVRQILSKLHGQLFESSHVSVKAHCIGYTLRMHIIISLHRPPLPFINVLLYCMARPINEYSQYPVWGWHWPLVSSHKFWEAKVKSSNCLFCVNIKKNKKYLKLYS